MLDSHYRPLVPVQLPYAGRQHYAHVFDLANPVMAEGFEDYLDPVTALIRAAGADHGTAFMTVDEKVIEAGMSQRRPRPHVDGVFMPEKMYWGTGGGWLHTCNNIGVGPVRRMPIIVASSVQGCRVWDGHFDTEVGEGGDLSHIADELGEGELVPAHHGYLLSGDCVHESMIFDRRVERTFLRIALPVDFVVQR